jgi:uncharacterized protein with GYD domain
MPLYILMTTLTAEGSQSLHREPDRLQQVNEEIEEVGCKIVAQYATLGPVDFVTVIEAPDNETAAVVSSGLSSRGTVRITSLPAFPVADFLGRLKAQHQLGKRS